nr:hypothetical protein [Tanacetum cinerariifolium]
MTTPNVTSSTDSQMHNNIMAPGSRDRPPMLAPGRYPQWRLRFLRYVDTRPSGKALRKCILRGPYKPTTVLVQAVEATDDSPVIPEHTTVETPMNMSPENKAHFLAEKEANHLILTGIGDEIYSTVDVCQTAQEIWEDIERLQQGESLNIQDVKINLFWEFGKFTSHDGETMESYYTRFYKLPEWSRFVTIVKQQHKLDEVSYHKLFDILKQYENEVNELRAERLARNANPLALVATAQANQDPPILPNINIAKPITPPSETASEEDSDPEQAQRDMDMQKNLALIAKYFKKIYKPTNNNLRTYSNSRNKNVDATPQFKNDNQSGQFGNQRTVNVAGARENECRKPKRVKDSGYHNEKMLLCKQAEQGVPLQAEQYDWQAKTNEEVNEQELEAHYSYMAKLREVPTADSSTNSEPVEHDSNVIPDSPDMCEDDIQNDQNDVESDDEQCKAILAETSKSLGESISVRDSCLVVLQTKQAEFEKYKAFNDRTIDYDKLERKLNEALGQLAQKDTVIKEGLKTKAYELSVVIEKHDELMKPSLLTKSHYECLVKQKTKVITDLKLREEHDIEKMLSMEKQLKFLNEIVYKRSQSFQTIHMMAPKVPTYNGRPTFANPRYFKQAQSEIPCLYPFPYDQNTHANRLIPNGEENLALERESQTKLNKDLVRPYDYTTLNSLYEIFKPPTQEYEIQLAQANEIRRKTMCIYDVKCSYLQSLSDLDALAELQCMYLHKVKECDCITQKLSKQTESVSKEVHNELLQRFAKVEKHSISLEIALQKCKEQVKNDTVCNEKASNVFRKEREQYFKIQDLKAQLQDKNIAIRVNHKPNVSRPQLKSNQSRDKVLPNNSQVKVKKTQVEVHSRIPSVSNKMKSVTACKDSLNSRTLNANVVYATCNKYLVDYNHFACVTKMLNDMNARTKKPNVVPISTRKPKSQANKSVATSHKKKIVQLIIFIVDSGCTKHMTGNLKLLCNFVERFLGTVRFGNDQFALILGYGDLVQGNVTINRVYYVEGLNHNLFSVGQFCDADLEVAFRKSTCFVRDLHGNDLLTRNRGSDLYTISLQESKSSTPLYLMAKATPTQAWLWHRRLSHINFDYINLLSKKDIVIGLPKLKYVKDQLCSSCELSKANISSFKSKVVPSSKGRLNLLHMDLCGPMRVASINRKKYILVVVDDYSRYTWTLFLRSKDETPEVLKYFLTMIQRNLQALVITVRTDRATEFLNKTLNAFFKKEGIEHQTSTARTPEQNGVVKRQNRTLVEAARTMLSASQLPLFFWVEAIATACNTQNRSIIISTHDKTPYHIINDRKPLIKHLHVFGCVCYITRDGENLDKMKEKGDQCILVRYSTQSKGYRVYNKRTRMIVKSIHIRFNEIKEVSETFVTNNTLGLVPQRQKASDYDNPDPVPQRQDDFSSADADVPSQQELDLLFGLLYDEFFNAGSNPQDKQPSTNIQSTSAPSTPTNDHAKENTDNQAEEGEHLQDDEFTNPFCAPTQDVAESFSHNIGNSNVPTFNQPQPHGAWCLLGSDGGTWGSSEEWWSGAENTWEVELQVVARKR